jgi:hypothetical protein
VLLTQLVPIPEPSPLPVGALKSFPIILTQRLVRGKSVDDGTERYVLVFGGFFGGGGRGQVLPSGKPSNTGTGGSLLHLCCLGVLFIVDEVLGQGISHELLGLVLHISCHE